jgi:hypothetical protein
MKVSALRATMPFFARRNAGSVNRDAGASMQRNRPEEELDLAGTRY